MLEEPTLFDWEPPSAEVIRMPISRWGQAIWRNLAGPVADGLLRRKSEASRAAFWKANVMRIEDGLQSLGAVTEAEIDAEVQRFRQAVIAEVVKRQSRVRSG